MASDQDLLTIEQYSEDEFVQLTWEQYGVVLDKLRDKIFAYVSDHQITFDVIVPILRGGGVLGTYLAGQLKVLRVVPVQYKYFIEGKHVYLKRLLDFPKDLALKSDANILIAENCYCFGGTTKAVVEEMHTKFPQAKIFVAADRMDYTFQTIEGVEQVFYGELNNDTKKLTDDECKKLGVDPTQYYYPWETIDEEIAACQLKQYKYSDLEAAEKDAPVAAHFDFS